MPNATSVFLNSYSQIPSLIASNIEPYFAPSMFKVSGVSGLSFKTGDLLARAAGGNIVPFTYDAAGTHLEFAGFCAYDTDQFSTDIRVVIQGALRVDLLNFAGVKKADGSAANLTLAQFLSLNNVKASVYDEFAFSGQQVMKLSSVSSVIPA